MRNLSLLAALSMVAVLAATPPSIAGGFCRAPCAPCYSVDVCCPAPCGTLPPYDIIYEPPVSGGGEIINSDPLSLNGAQRTWVYGDSPRLVIGTLQSMESGQVSIAKREGGVATIPMEQLSSLDQKIVATRLAAGNRTWTDRSQRFQRTAEFVRVEGQNVILKTDTGKAINVAFARLSRADQCVVKHLSGTPIVDESIASPTEVFVSR